MSPAAIVRRAREVGLGLIAITDHNSMENSFQAAALAERSGLGFFFGMEAQTREDVHFICLFAERKPAERFFERIYALLPDVRNNPDFFGDQVVVDEEENVLRFEPKLLLNALDLSITGLLEEVGREGGRVIPSHVESDPFGLLPTLGSIPEELAGCLLELSYQADPQKIIALYPELHRFSLIGNSDAHSLAEVGRCWTEFEAAAPTLETIYAAGLSGNFRRLNRGPHG